MKYGPLPAMYISLWEHQGIPIVSLMQFSTNMWSFEQKDSHALWDLCNSYGTVPIREIFHFHHLPKLYFGFNFLNGACVG